MKNITIPIELYDEIWCVLRANMFWFENGEEGNNDDVIEVIDKMEKHTGRGYKEIEGMK